ncbi:hypothetical protein SBOR_2891 [Sclerotinia borealis F-4128]|uniref:PAS domain-containing protein n=1 Tax=Sclerotinia borealis (strain F-4128) TaxID=1432307 RepID=W9CJ08_SCLBF|nr:hypothetical protein SBOR_2891 [Sclerotinia borealis F-4128]
MLNPEHEEQLKKLKEIQALYAEHAATTRNQQDKDKQGTTSRPDSSGSTSSDPMIFPGLYSPSGFDVLQILFQVQRRPNPTYALGNIDSGVALVLCDSSRPHCPIVYCSEPFQRLTGYSQAEIVGKNCRFLQYPYDAHTFEKLGNIATATTTDLQTPIPLDDPNMAGKSIVRKALDGNLEAQVTLVNYRKNGERFLNILTTVPVRWTAKEGEVHNYIVGFQAVAPHMFRTRGVSLELALPVDEMGWELSNSLLYLENTGISIAMLGMLHGAWGIDWYDRDGRDEMGWDDRYGMDDWTGMGWDG